MKRKKFQYFLSDFIAREQILPVTFLGLKIRLFLFEKVTKKVTQREVRTLTKKA